MSKEVGVTSSDNDVDGGDTGGGGGGVGVGVGSGSGGGSRDVFAGSSSSFLRDFIRFCDGSRCGWVITMECGNQFVGVCQIPSGFPTVM